MLKHRFNFFLALILIAVTLIGCERPIRRTSTTQDVQSYATKSAIEVIEGKVFVPTRDVQLLSDLNLNQQVQEVAEAATPTPTNTAEPTTTPEPSNTPEPTNTVEPTETPEPSSTPTEEPTEVVELAEVDDDATETDDLEDETESDSAIVDVDVDVDVDEDEDEPVTTPVVIIAQTMMPTATPNWAATQAANGSGQPVATPNWAATQAANGSGQPVATPNWAATQAANSSGQPVATPNWAATQAANNGQPTATPNWTATQTANNSNNNTNTVSAEADNIFYHTIQTQENLFRIGLIYNVPWPLIAAANEITDETQLEVGDQIVIPFLNSDGTEQTADIPAQPANDTTTDAPAATPVPPVATEQLTYIVQQGDTLYSISTSFGLSVDAVAAANGIINPEVIETGMTLIIPVPNVDLPDAPEQYVVVAGDTLYEIGMRFGVSWREIATINNIPSPFNIEIGQTLVIP